MQKPQTKKEDTVEDIDGISVSDPYRWIEDGKSKEVVLKHIIFLLRPMLMVVISTQNNILTMTIKLIILRMN